MCDWIKSAGLEIKSKSLQSDMNVVIVVIVYIRPHLIFCAAYLW